MKRSHLALAALVVLAPLGAPALGWAEETPMTATEAGTILAAGIDEIARAHAEELRAVPNEPLARVDALFRLESVLYPSVADPARYRAADDFVFAEAERIVAILGGDAIAMPTAYREHHRLLYLAQLTEEALNEPEPDLSHLLFDAWQAFYIQNELHARTRSNPDPNPLEGVTYDAVLHAHMAVCDRIVARALEEPAVAREDSSEDGEATTAR